MVSATYQLMVGESKSGGELDEIVIDSEEFKSEVDKGVKERM